MSWDVHLQTRFNLTSSAWVPGVLPFQSWIWLQKAIHPELDYDLCLKKKWVSDRNRIVDGSKASASSVHL